MADITSNDEPLLELALFAGAGGGILGGKLLGWRTVCAVEINAYAASVLIARQNDGCLEPFPVWDDIRTFRSDNQDCAGMFEMLRAVRHRLVISGGFPCQDISVAGAGAGLDGERSGLWSEQARVIREIRPRFAFVENSPALTGRGLHRVLADLAAMGFDAEWCVLGASDVGLPHYRKRIWIRGSNSDRRKERVDVAGAHRRVVASTDDADAERLPGSGGGRLDELGGSGNPFRGTEIGKLRINPRWDEQRMGWPTDWTDCEQSETDKFHCAPPSPGSYFQQWIERMSHVSMD